MAKSSSDPAALVLAFRCLWTVRNLERAKAGRGGADRCAPPLAGGHRLHTGRDQLWLQAVFALAERLTDLAISTLAAKRRSLDRQLGAILATPSGCDLTRELQAKIGRARDQLLVFLAYPGTVEPTNNGSERLLRPAVVQRKMTNGYRAMWAAESEAAIRTVVDTACLTGQSPFGTILKTVGA